MRFIRRSITIIALLAIVVFPSISHAVIIKAANASLTIGTVERLDNLDPADAGDVFTWSVLSHLYSGLTRQIPGTLRYELALAASHTVSADGLQHIFTVRPDAAFDDGTPITAQTFADSINRVIKLGGKGSLAVTPYLKSADVDSSGALVLTLNTPIPYLEQLLALPPFYAVHPADFPTNDFKRTPGKLASSGVYRLAAFDPGRSITLAANPAWKGDPPATATIMIRHYDNPGDLRRALVAHEVDIAWRGLPPDEVETARRTQGIQKMTAPGLQSFYLLIAQAKPFDTLAARQGLTYLINRENLAQTSLLGTAVPLYSLIPPEVMPDINTTARFPAFDVAQAKKVLQAGGYSKFKTIDGDIQTASLLYGDLSRRALDQVVASLRQGEAYQISGRDLEPGAFLDALNRGTFTLMLVGWTPIVPHPDAYLRPLLHSKGQLAAGLHTANSALDTLLDNAASNGDSAAYQQAMTQATQDVLVIPLWQDQQTLLAWDTVSGIVIEPNYLLRFDRLSIR